jgi:tRNA pseudouridine38-40 synthase
MSKRWLKLTLAYDGGAYVGWQVQPDKPTVQGTLESALRQITQEAVRVTASGRTDAGVHALGQVVGCSTATRLANADLQRALNAVLPNDVAVLLVEDAAEGFHATRDAVAKRYRYQIHNGRTRSVFDRHFAWHYPQPLDAAAMHAAGQVLLGRHDFSSFETAGSERPDSIRTIHELTVTRGGEELADRVTLEVVGDGFLYNMVRTIVGTLVEVGVGARDANWPAAVLAACDRRAAGQTAPPHGLFLVNVSYASSNT